jgi:hypothetical protein
MLGPGRVGILRVTILMVFKDDAQTNGDLDEYVMLEETIKMVIVHPWCR